MGIAGSPDIFQEKMLELMESLEFVRGYLDNLLCISKLSLEDHREKLEEVLRGLPDAGLKVNAAKLTFRTLEVEYLGYVLTRDSVKPQSNKVQAILAIKPPTGVRQLRHFLGMVQYNRDLWARRSNMLAPLTSLVGECGQTKSTKAKGTIKIPWHWEEVHQRAFDHVKATIAKDVVLVYLDYSKVFGIYTDASSKQLGAVITHDNRPIGFFSHNYLQHPGHSRLKETMRSVMYWKGMRTTSRKYVRSFRSCQVNKRQSQKYGHLPPKLVITTPWKALCVDLICPYTLKGKDGSSIDFMCLTMINPATSWFEIVEIPTLKRQLFPQRVKVKR
jgi:hypothetical protein